MTPFFDRPIYPKTEMMDLLRKLEKVIARDNPDRLPAYHRYLEQERLAALGTIREQLTDHMRRSGESVTAISKAAGISQPAFGKFLKGERDLKVSTLDKLSVYLNLRLVQIKDPPEDLTP